jgi:electron transfer flavoprotein beta subunit
MNIAVLVKQVPDTYSARKLTPGDWTLDRGAADAVIDEIDAKAVEVALSLTEAVGGEVVVVTMGPDRATETIRKALSMGAHRAVHVVDEALAGSDALATSAVLAAAVQTLEVDLVLAGNESTDGRVSAVGGMVAERLGWPSVSQAQQVSSDGSSLAISRSFEGGVSDVAVSLPAVVSVTEKIAEPRYPNFKGIMAAKSKPVATLSIADLGIDAGVVGLGGAATVAVDGAPRPPKSAGEKITDDGTAGASVIEFLAARRLV